MGLRARRTAPNGLRPYNNHTIEENEEESIMIDKPPKLDLKKSVKGSGSKSSSSKSSLEDEESSIMSERLKDNE